MLKRPPLFLFCMAFLLGLALLPQAAFADCLTLKNDTFDDEKKTPVTAVRSFCISERFGTIFKADKDVIVQKVRMLISGDGKSTMNSTTLKLIIYKEKAADSADPGSELVTETPYQVPAATTSGPSWFEVGDLNIPIKAGESFRVTFSHATIDCETRITPGDPLCAEACGWWGATVDNGPLKAKANIVEGSMFKCDALQPKERKWRFFGDLPASCKPPGNVIVRALVYDKQGKDCKGGGVTPPGCTDGATQACTCADNSTKTQTCSGGTWSACPCSSGGICTPDATRACACQQGSGTQTCSSDGSSWGDCLGCSSTPPTTTCTPGATQECVCTGGKGAQTCKEDGSGWQDCNCGSSGDGKPTVTSVTPKEGPVGQNTDITIIGTNFQQGAKVRIGNDIQAVNVTVVGDKTITAVVPSDAKGGKYNITVENPDGQNGTLLDGFTVILTGCNGSFSSQASPLQTTPVLWLLVLFLITFRRRKD